MCNVPSGFRNVQTLTLTLICELTTPLNKDIARAILFIKNVTNLRLLCNKKMLS